MGLSWTLKARLAVASVDSHSVPAAVSADTQEVVPVIRTQVPQFHPGPYRDFLLGEIDPIWRYLPYFGASRAQIVDDAGREREGAARELGSALTD